MDQRSRPESSNSAQMRMTPTSSSNSSSAHLPGRRAPSASGGASLLQERLRERKVESARQSRRRSVDLSDGDRGVQSSPVKGSGRESVSNGVAVGKGMGVKQIEEVCYLVLGFGSFANYWCCSKFLHCINRISTSSWNYIIVANGRKLWSDN